MSTSDKELAEFAFDEIVGSGPAPTNAKAGPFTNVSLGDFVQHTEKYDPDRCPECGGQGEIVMGDGGGGLNGAPTDTGYTETCTTCDGTGDVGMTTVAKQALAILDGAETIAAPDATTDPVAHITNQEARDGGQERLEGDRRGATQTGLDGGADDPGPLQGSTTRSQAGDRPLQP